VSQVTLNNIERAYEAMSRLDAEALVAVCALKFADRGSRRRDVSGSDGVRDYIASLAEVFEWIRTEPLDVIDEGDRAVVCNLFRGRGRGSGAEVEERFFQAPQIPRSQVLVVGVLPSKAEALQAVGISAKTATPTCSDRALQGDDPQSVASRDG
jgi:ketosteroid isomerase-like protein